MGGWLIVVAGAELKCTLCPGGKSYLTPTTSGDKIEGKHPATLKDHISGIHVHPFSGTCLTLKGPCKPNTPSPWQDSIFSGLFFAKNPLSQDLSPNDKLKCTHRGEISVVDSCQSTVIVGAAVSAEAAEDDDDGGKSFWDIMKPVVSFAGLAAAADGPLPIGDTIGGATVIGGSAVAGGIVLADSLSDDNSGGESNTEEGSGSYEEQYGDYEYEDPREGKRGPLKGGKRPRRDRDFGLLNDKDFLRWWERHKQGRGDIKNRKEAEDALDEWDKAGRPKR